MRLVSFPFKAMPIVEAYLLGLKVRSEGMLLILKFCSGLKKINLHYKVRYFTLLSGVDVVLLNYCEKT